MSSAFNHLKNDSATAFDRDHIWHPYSSLTAPILPLHVASASGVYLELKDGLQLIDGMASWWSVIHGYNHPKINAAATQQLEKMSHVMFGGLTHDPAIALCQQLIDITPAALSNVFLSDSGSVAVEVAMKLALQYWRETNTKPGSNKTRFIALRGGYHGDTLGAMSVCDPVTGMHHLFSEVLAKQFFVDRPGCRFGEACTASHLEQLESTLAKHHDNIAAIILEPIVQGAGGMYFYAADYLRAVRQLCDDYKVLLIADEIATGFARSGELFACDHAHISPDILCLGKAMTGGYLSLAATLSTADIAAGVSGGHAGAFMHGPTFMGNPLACSIASKSIELLLNQDWQANIQRIEQRLAINLNKLTHEKIKETRVLGAIGVIETRNPVNMHQVQQILPALGVWLRPFGNRIYTMPPYITSDRQLDRICEAMVEIAISCST